MKLVLVAGGRPNFMKIASISEAIDAHNDAAVGHSRASWCKLVSITTSRYPRPSLGILDCPNRISIWGRLLVTCQPNGRNQKAIRTDPFAGTARCRAGGSGRQLHGGLLIGRREDHVLVTLGTLPPFVRGLVWTGEIRGEPHCQVRCPYVTLCQ